MDSKEYLEEVYRVRTFLIKQLQYSGFGFAENKSLVPKPEWHNRIMPTGAIGLICWKNGLPMSLMTPWGEIRFVDIDNNSNGGFDQNIPEGRVEQFMKEIQKMFCLHSMAPGQTVHGFSCPTYSIQSFPWNNQSPCFIEMKNMSVTDDEQTLIDTYNAGKQLCIAICGHKAGV